MKGQKHLLAGAVLILTGVFLLLRNLDLIPELPHYVFSWLNIFLLFAMFSLISGRVDRAFRLLGVWLFFGLHEFWGLEYRNYWPIIIILIGLSILLKQRSITGGHGIMDRDYFESINIFGQKNYILTSKTLRGGKITNIFGGSMIDFCQSTPAGTASVDLFTIFGGCEIIVPEDWNVSIQASAIFGGFEDKRSHRATIGPGLVVRGITIFGGGKLRNRKA